MKQFALLIYAPPLSPAAGSALKFARAVLAEGHAIQRLFFFQDGVYNACSLLVPPQDEVNLPLQWQTLIREQEIDAVVCVSSALKRGILDSAESGRYEKNAVSLLSGFTISGLGQLLDAARKADRLISFMP